MLQDIAVGKQGFLFGKGRNLRKDINPRYAKSGKLSGRPNPISVTLQGSVSCVFRPQIHGDLDSAFEAGRYNGGGLSITVKDLA